MCAIDNSGGAPWITDVSLTLNLINALSWKRQVVSGALLDV